MHDVLADIRNKLQAAAYRNEEHVRLSLVCRLLAELGWNIWDPAEVDTEFLAIPTEDKTRVDIALLARKGSPSVFLEIKAVGRITASLSEVERQVRDYNRNNTALFSVITDGRSWRLYYSQTGGEFHHKCFKECDLLEDDLEDVEQTFSLFLRKESILNGSAEDHAGKYLQLTKKQKAVQDCLPEARRRVQAPPYPSLPQAIVKLLEQKGFALSESEAAELLDRMPEASTPPALSEVRARTRKGDSRPNLGRKRYQQVPVRESYAFAEPHEVSVLGSTKPVKTWKEVLLAVCERLSELHPSELDKFLKLDKYFSRDPREFHTPREISSTGIFVETNRGADAIARMCEVTLAQFGHSQDELRVHSRKPDSGSDCNSGARTDEGRSNLGEKKWTNLRNYVIPVVKLMRDGKSHTEAFKVVAGKLGVTRETVADQCTRKFNINTEEFVEHVRTGHIVEVLRERYQHDPHKLALIDKELGA